MKILNTRTPAGLLLAFSALTAAPSAHAQSYLSPGYIMGEIGKGLGVVKPEPAPK